MASNHYHLRCVAFFIFDLANQDNSETNSPTTIKHTTANFLLFETIIFHPHLSHHSNLFQDFSHDCKSLKLFFDAFEFGLQFVAKEYSDLPISKFQ